MTKRKIIGKSQVPVFFNDWLLLMENAFAMLTAAQFRELENKIKVEIEFHQEAKEKKNER